MKMTFKQKFYSILDYLPALLFFLLIITIIVMADMGNENMVFQFVKAIPQGDKIAHLLLYGILTFLLNIALKFRAFNFARYELQWGAILVLCFAFIEEMSQYFFPNRTLSLADAIADLIGVSLFSYLSLKIKQRKIKANPDDLKK